MPGAFREEHCFNIKPKKTYVKIGERKTKGSERQRPGRDGWPIAVDLVRKGTTDWLQIQDCQSAAS